MIDKNAVGIVGQAIKSGEKIITSHGDNKTKRLISDNTNKTNCHVSDNKASTQKFTATLNAVSSGLTALTNVVSTYKDYCVSKDTNQINLDKKSQEIAKNREIELNRIASNLEKVKIECNKELEAQSDRLDFHREIVEYYKNTWQELFEFLKGDRELLVSPAGTAFLQQMSVCQNHLRDISITLAQESSK